MSDAIRVKSGYCRSAEPGMDLIAEAYEAGVRLLGENRVKRLQKRRGTSLIIPTSDGRSSAICRPTRPGRWQPSRRSFMRSAASK